MKKIYTILLLILLLCSGSVWAGDFEDGVAAYERKDFSTAISKFQSAAVQGDAGAQFYLGFMNSNGKGVVQDYTEAVRWYKLAAAQGDASAQFNLGVMYGKGQGVVQDYTEAVRWYRLAAAQGLARAQSNLGFMYSKGQGVVQDFTRAHMWYNLAAVTGDTVPVENRDLVAAKMTTQQIAEAQKMARECQARGFQNCN